LGGDDSDGSIVSDGSSSSSSSSSGSSSSDSEDDLFAEGLSIIDVNSVQDIERIMKLGQENRSVGSHNFNEHSSRSHLVVTVYIERIDDDGDLDHERIIYSIYVGSVNLVVDLISTKLKFF
jgi:hypothetical protein